MVTVHRAGILQLNRMPEGDPAAGRLRQPWLDLPHLIGEIPVQRHDVHATALVKADRLDVVVPGGQPEALAALPGPLPGPGQQGRADTPAFGQAVEGDDLQAAGPAAR